MKQVFLAHPVVTQIVTMIRGKYDHGVFKKALCVKVVKQYSHLIVDLLDQTHVGGDHPFAHFVV